MPRNMRDKFTDAITLSEKQWWYLSLPFFGGGVHRDDLDKVRLRIASSRWSKGLGGLLNLVPKTHLLGNGQKVTYNHDIGLHNINCWWCRHQNPFVNLA